MTPVKGSSVLQKRLLAAALLVTVLFACGQPKVVAPKRAPETEIVLLYQSDVKAEIEECG